MIDIESDVFNLLATSLRSKYNNIYITGECLKIPSSFPCVSIIEVDNIINLSTSDSSNIENHAKVTYEINIYSNKNVGKKTECKVISKLINDVLSKVGFTRIMLQPISNLEDNSIYRIVGRYNAIVSKNNVIYRR